VWYYQFTKGQGIQWSVDLTGIKLLEYAMKVVERIFEHRIRQQIDIGDMQFGFMKGKGTTDVIFIVRQWIWEKLLIGFREKCYDGQCISWELKNG